MHFRLLLQGAHIISNGRETQVLGTNTATSRLRDFELAQSDQQVDLTISIGKFSKIKMSISTARVRKTFVKNCLSKFQHLTVAFNQLKQITNRVTGIIGEFYRQEFSISGTEQEKFNRT